MKAITVQGRSGRSSILIGESLDRIEDYLPDTHLVIITDTNVRRLYGDRFPRAEIIEIGIGESIKTLATVQEIYARLIACNADRTSFLLGIGGGLVCDVTGFVASTYMRGIRFGFVATTLLAQVDASVGGKNGVNFAGYKNMVGVFNQPEFVICDPAVLGTLPQRECKSGFAEIIKHAAIADPAMFDFLEQNSTAALALDADAINRLVSDSVRIKSTIVNRDETEKDERRKLNFGHTFGHAIEKTVGITHGEAVAVGMIIAAGLSVAKGLLRTDQADRLSTLVARYDLPTSVPSDKNDILDALLKDKKRTGETILFVLLKDIGTAEIVPFLPEELMSFWGTY